MIRGLVGKKSLSSSRPLVAMLASIGMLCVVSCSDRKCERALERLNSNFAAASRGGREMERAMSGARAQAIRRCKAALEESPDRTANTLDCLIEASDWVTSRACGNPFVDWIPPKGMEHSSKEPSWTKEPTEVAEIPPRDGGEEPSATTCSDLSRIECMRSTSCTLVLPEGEPPYVCRAAQPPCEVGLRQAHPKFADMCEQRAGCQITPANCYCKCKGYGETSVPDINGTPECRCRCSGGPPNNCTSSGR